MEENPYNAPAQPSAGETRGRAGVNRGSKWLCIPLIVVGLIPYPVLQVLGGLGLFSGGQQWAMRIWPFLLSGPLAILLLALLGIWQRRLAGWLFVGAALLSAIFAVRVMWSSPAEWSGDPSGIPGYAFRWSLTLIFPISVPLLLVGIAFLAWSRESAK